MLAHHLDVEVRPHRHLDRRDSRPVIGEKDTIRSVACGNSKGPTEASAGGVGAMSSGLANRLDRILRLTLRS